MSLRVLRTLCAAVFVCGIIGLIVSSVLDNYRGVSGVALSVPSIVGSDGVSGLIDVPFSVHEAEQFQRSAEAIRKTLRDLGID